MDFQNKRVLSFEEGCEFLGYKKSYVYKLTSSGVIPFCKPNGKKIFFDRLRLEEWVLGINTPGEQREILASTFLSKDHI